MNSRIYQNNIFKYIFLLATLLGIIVLAILNYIEYYSMDGAGLISIFLTGKLSTNPNELVLWERFLVHFGSWLSLFQLL